MLRIGVLQFSLHIHHAQSLKDKRRVVKSFKDRTRQRFNVSIAEIDDLDDHNTATLGVTMAGADPRYINGALDKLLQVIENLPDAELMGHQLEII
jgi:uncharacterized protein YlxP (DUF503 family)